MGELGKRIIESTTEDFVQAFTKEEDYRGFTASLIGHGHLPDGVDIDDARVQRIIAKCSEWVK